MRVRKRARDRESERKGERERERKRGCERDSVSERTKTARKSKNRTDALTPRVVHFEQASRKSLTRTTALLLLQDLV